MDVIVGFGCAMVHDICGVTSAVLLAGCESDT